MKNILKIMVLAGFVASVNASESQKLSWFQAAKQGVFTMPFAGALSFTLPIIPCLSTYWANINLSNIWGKSSKNSEKLSREEMWNEKCHNDIEHWERQIQIVSTPGYVKEELLKEHGKKELAQFEQVCKKELTRLKQRKNELEASCAKRWNKNDHLNKCIDYYNQIITVSIVVGVTLLPYVIYKLWRRTPKQIIKQAEELLAAKTVSTGDKQYYQEKLTTIIGYLQGRDITLQAKAQETLNQLNNK